MYAILALALLAQNVMELKKERKSAMSLLACICASNDISCISPALEIVTELGVIDESGDNNHLITYFCNKVCNSYIS